MTAAPADGRPQAWARGTRAHRVDEQPGKARVLMSDIEEITQLLLHERQARDRGWWDRMAACYHRDSHVEASWFSGTGAEFVECSRNSSPSGPVGTHRLSPPVIHVNVDRAVVELPMTLEVRAVINGVAADGCSAARMLDRVRRDKDGWKIQTITAIFERDTLTPAVPGTTLDIDPRQLDQYREPCRCLAYLVSRQGLTPSDDVHGDDQPDRVAALYRAAFDWLDGNEAASENEPEGGHLP